MERQIPTGTRAVTLPKSEAGIRTVGMLGPVKEVLMDLALQRLDAGPDDPVFTNSRGGLLHHRNFARRVWEPALRRAGVALRFHELRHTFASFLIYFTRGDVMYVAGQLGHSTPRMTLQTYAHQFTEARKGSPWTGMPSCRGSLTPTGCLRWRLTRIWPSPTGPPQNPDLALCLWLKPLQNLVETSGFEPPTSSLRTRRSPS